MVVGFWLEDGKTYAIAPYARHRGSMWVSPARSVVILCIACLTACLGLPLGLGRANKMAHIRHDRPMICPDRQRLPSMVGRSPKHSPYTHPIMSDTLKNKQVAILATDGYELSELDSPRKALKEAGATVHVVSLKSGTLKGWKNGDWNGSTEVDRTLDKVSVDEYDALVIPGGVINPDTLRKEEKAVRFVRGFFTAKKPVAAICHGPWLLAEADVLQGRKVTSYASIKTDLKNAGAEWVDEEVVVDQGLVTSRDPKDLPAFNAKLVEEVSEGIHARQKA